MLTAKSKLDSSMVDYRLHLLKLLGNLSDKEYTSIESLRRIQSKVCAHSDLISVELDSAAQDVYLASLFVV